MRARHVLPSHARPPFHPPECRTADGVLEYSLSQTTLEQVFLEVASEARQHAAR